MWEPPTLEVFDKFVYAAEDNFDFFTFNSKELKAQLPDVEVRSRLLDLVREFALLGVYKVCADKTLKDARDVGDQAKIAFYEGC